MSGTIGGVPATFASIREWHEAEFAYIEYVLCWRDRDARTEALALHDPPMVLVSNVRRGSDLPRKP